MYIATSPFTARRPNGVMITFQKNQKIRKSDLKSSIFLALVNSGRIKKVSSTPKDLYVPEVKEKKEMPLKDPIESTMIQVNTEKVKDLKESKDNSEMDFVDRQDREQVVATFDEDGKMDLVEKTSDIDLTNAEDLEPIKMDDLRKIAKEIGAKTSRKKSKLIKNITKKASK